MPATRRTAAYLTSYMTIPFAHGQVTVTTPLKLYKTSNSRQLQIVRVNYVNPTGLVAHASNYFTLQIKNASTVAALWSTQVGADGTLTANSFVDFVNQAASALFLPVSTELSISLTLTGTQTLPAGSGTIEAILL